MQNCENKSGLTMRAASSDEAARFYALSPEQDIELGCIGHVRIDFGRSGTEFWHTWHPRGPEELNSTEFKEELGEVVDAMRNHVLKNFASMSSFCNTHGGEISGGWAQNYGYVMETDNYQYYLRCNPVRGDYHAYLTCYDKRIQQMNQPSVVGIVHYANGEAAEYRDAQEYLNTIREELPYASATGFRFETQIDDPQIRKAIDDAIYDLYGEVKPNSVEECTPKAEMQLGGI
ncbi:MAG: hypothetical protein ACI3W5_08340 [Faecousia sp.]